MFISLRTETEIAHKKVLPIMLRMLHSLFAIFNEIEISTSEKCKLFDSLVSFVLNYSLKITKLMTSKKFILNIYMEGSGSATIK